ncbi:retrovirus-related pol polyprotein from transposon TNT 1-94 [Tanacetum coccineum]
MGYQDLSMQNVIRDLIARYHEKELKIDAMWCYFDAFLTYVKTDEFGGVLKNNARLVAQGFRQEDGIDFEESIALVARIEAIPQKSPYGLKQAPRAWYDMLLSFLISQHFSKGAVDPTLFTRKAGNDLLLVQIYVDDIIFASTNTALCNEFVNLMTTKFKMSMMGQMSFFLGSQISQSPRGIFLNQSKYAYEIIKNYGLLTSDSVNTLMVEKNKLDDDLQGTPVDATLFTRGMIWILLYLIPRRPGPYLCSLLYVPNMNLVSAQQVSLDNALVAPEKRLKIEKSNEELSSASHKERKHIKSHWMLLNYLLATPHSLSMLKY